MMVASTIVEYNKGVRYNISKRSHQYFLVHLMHMMHSLGDGVIQDVEGLGVPAEHQGDAHYYIYVT